MRFALAIAVLAMTVRDAAADRVAVRVIEVAGGFAYVEPGARAGLRPGLEIRFGRARLTIVEVADTMAAVRIGTSTIAVGDRGTADVKARGAAIADKLPPPRTLDTFRGKWPDPVRPATAQTPARVPLGAARQPGRAHVAVLGTAFAAADRENVAAEAQTRVIASYDLWQDGRVGADLDATARVYGSGPNGRERVPLWIRAAQVRYGAARDPQLAIGRLPWAAIGVGVLDGVRAAVRLGSFELAGFGGVVPDLLSGRPDTGASRFGAEAIYDDAAGDWQPRLAITAHGSTWDGAIDERIVRAGAGVTRGGLAVDGWAEVQSFAADNPWGARAIELTGAGVGGEYRRRGLHAGGDVSVLRPERSRRLAAVLPREWLCTTIPEPGDVTTEACAGNDALWGWATGSAGVATRRWFVDVGGSVGTTHAARRHVDVSGFGRTELRRLPRDGRAIAGVAGGRTSVVDWIGGEIGGGVSPIDDVEATIMYRPEILAYRASTTTMLLHTASLDVRWSVRLDLDVAANAGVTTGTDREAIVIVGSVAWRPLP